MTEIQTERMELLALHSCIITVLENKIPTTPAEIGLLMEGLTVISRYDKNTNKEFKLKMDNKFVTPLWHCCNIVIRNNLFENQTHMTDIIKIMEKLAKRADALRIMERPVLELVK